MVKKIIFLVVLSLFFATSIFAVEVAILHSSNLYGTVFPYDYFKDSYEAKGLAVIDTFVNIQRHFYSDLLLIDTGNLLYGTPFGDFSRTLGDSPVVEAFNLVGYDVFVPGTFELNLNKTELSKTFQKLKANILGGNLRNVQKVQSYVVKQLKSGLKIGIIGVVVPYGNYEFDELVNSVRKAITNAKSEGANILVLATSGGITNDPITGKQLALESPLNVGDRLVKEFSKDIDVFLFGNQAFVYASAKSNKVYSLPGSEGNGINKIILDVEKSGNSWKMKSARIEHVDFLYYSPSVEFLRNFETYERSFQNWLMETVFTSAITSGFSKYLALLEDNIALEIINKAIIEYTKSSAGIWNIFNPNFTGIVEGPISRKDLYALVGKPTTVKLVRMSGKDIKNILIRASQSKRYENGKVVFDEKLVDNPWLFDMFENIRYEIVANEGTVRNIIYVGKNLEDNDTVVVSVPSIRTYGKEPVLYGKVIKDFELPVQHIFMNTLDKILNAKVLDFFDDANRTTVVKLEYTVNAGDTLRNLSYRLGVSEDALLAENTFIKDRNLLRPGWKLVYYKGYLNLIPPLKEFFEIK